MRVLSRPPHWAMQPGIGGVTLESTKEPSKSKRAVRVADHVAALEKRHESMQRELDAAKVTASTARAVTAKAQEEAVAAQQRREEAEQLADYLRREREEMRRAVGLIKAEKEALEKEGWREREAHRLEQLTATQKINRLVEATEAQHALGTQLGPDEQQQVMKIAKLKEERDEARAQAVQEREAGARLQARLEEALKHRDQCEAALRQCHAGAAAADGESATTQAKTEERRRALECRVFELQEALAKERGSNASRREEQEFVAPRDEAEAEQRARSLKFSTQSSARLTGDGGHLLRRPLCARCARSSRRRAARPTSSVRATRVRRPGLRRLAIRRSPRSRRRKTNSTQRSPSCRLLKLPPPERAARATPVSR